MEGAAQLEFPDIGTVIVKQPRQPNQTFSFDRVFHDVSVTQREVYEYAAKETVTFVYLITSIFISPDPSF